MADVGLDMKLERFEPDRAAYKAILNSGPVIGLLEEEGSKVRSRAASMYKAREYGMKARAGESRAHAFVYTASKHAINSNVRHNTLSKALG